MYNQVYIDLIMMVKEKKGNLVNLSNDILKQVNDLFKSYLLKKNPIDVYIEPNVISIYSEILNYYLGQF